MKEVTETTTLRVSHDIRLDVASYQVTSNTFQNHQQHFNINQMENEETIEHLHCQEPNSNGSQLSKYLTI